MQQHAVFYSSFTHHAHTSQCFRNHGWVTASPFETGLVQVSLKVSVTHPSSEITEHHCNWLEFLLFSISVKTIIEI